MPFPWARLYFSRRLAIGERPSAEMLKKYSVLPPPPLPKAIGAWPTIGAPPPTDRKPHQPLTPPPLWLTEKGQRDRFKRSLSVMAGSVIKKGKKKVKKELRTPSPYRTYKKEKKEEKGSEDVPSFRWG